MRATASPPSSPAPSPSLPPAPRVSRSERRGKSKLDMAGLIGGDSDSSALTQESGDEGVPTPRESVVTGTDAGTDYAEDEDAEMRDLSPGMHLSIIHREHFSRTFTSPFRLVQTDPWQGLKTREKG
jgi:MRG-binding protein